MQTRLFFRLIIKNVEIYLLKILTLAVAFAALVLVTVFSINELGYDKFHQNYKNIFRIIEKNETETDSSNKYSSKISNDFYNSLDTHNNLTLARTKVLNKLSSLVDGKTIHNQQIHAADANITDIFTFNIKHGEMEEFGRKTKSILLSTNIAEQYFGTSDVVGKEVSLFTFGDTLHLKVAAVYESFPSNSHQNFQAFIHFNGSSLDKLKFDATTSEVYGRKKDMGEFKMPHFQHKSYSTQALADIYFGSRMTGEEVEHGDFYSVIILISITSLILFLALTSFINLTSLVLPHRVKELAVKKLAGHNNLQLIIGFIGESFVILLISLVFSGLILWICLETSKSIQVINFPMLIRQELIPLTIVVFSLILLLALTPLLMIRKFVKATPIRLLSPDAITFPRFKKMIIILQLGISIFLIVSANVINRQVTYSLVKEPGRNNHQVVYVSYPDEMTDDLLRSLREGWRKSRPNILNIMATSQLPNQISSRDLNTGVYSISVDSEFNDFFDIEMVQGGWFGPNDGDSIMVVNESAFQKISGSSLNIRGVYKDISGQFNLPEKPIKIVRESYFNHNFLCIRILEVDILKTINFLERYFEQNGRPSNVQFMDRKFENWLNYQVRLNSFTNLLTIIAALLSCCAIYGLSISVLRDKLKQIAIRKICGADLFHIIYLLVKEFSINLFIAILFFAPITYIVLNELLRAFVYSTHLTWVDPIFPLSYCAFVIVVLCIWQAFTLNRSDLSGALKSA